MQVLLLLSAISLFAMLIEDSTALSQIEFWLSVNWKNSSPSGIPEFSLVPNRSGMVADVYSRRYGDEYLASIKAFPYGLRWSSYHSASANRASARGVVGHHRWGGGVIGVLLAVR